MRRITLDASVIVKALLTRLEEIDSDMAVRIWQAFGRNEIALIQPPHWIAEVAGALARLSPNTAVDDVFALTQTRPLVHENSLIYYRACEIAIELKHHLFDTLYHAVALESPDCILVTADESYYRKARHYGQIARLGDYELEF